MEEGVQDSNCQEESAPYRVREGESKISVEAQGDLQEVKLPSL